MSTDLTQLLRLEIERDPDEGELINLIPNPTGELGAWGWVTPVAGSVLRGNFYPIPYRHFRLEYTSPGSVASYFYTEPIAVMPGEYVASRWSAWDVDGKYKVQVEWLDSSKSVTGHTAATSNLTESADPVIYGSFLIPSGTAYCRLRFDHLNTSGGNPGADTHLDVHDVVLTAAGTSGALGWQRTNLLTNPTASSAGTAGWLTEGGTIDVTTDQAVAGTYSFAMTKTGSKGALVATALVPDIRGGRDYALQTRVRPGSTARVAGVSVRWITDSGKTTDAIVALYDEVAGTWSGPIGGVVTAPTGATFLMLRVIWSGVHVGETHYFDANMVEQASTVGPYFDGSTTDAGGIAYDWTGSANASTSTATGATGDVGTLVPVPYQNILGPTASIATDREDLNVGSMTVKLYDAILDPTQTDLVRPGRRVRLLTTAGDVIFAGKSMTATVAYHLLEHDENKRAEVNITAVDAITALASTMEREGVATIAELPYVLEGAGVPWSCNGSGDQVASATVVSYNDNASVLDQVAVTRDSVLGYAWVDRNGVLQAWDRSELDATVSATFDESVYNTDIDIGFDMDRITNSVTVVVLSQIATTGVTEELTFGPYVDSDSYRTYGEHAATYTIQGIDPTDLAAIADYAQQILDVNATPQIRVNSMVVPIRTADDLPLALTDLYDLVTVSNDRASVDEDTRVLTVQHSITPSKWLMTVGFMADGSVASATTVPSPPPGVGKVVDDLKGGYTGTLQEIYDAADDAAAAAADAAANATIALTAANGKNKVTYSLAAPGATPNTAGDIWFQKDSATQTIIGQWQGLGGTSWQQVTLASVVIANLDAGKLVAGSAFINGLSVKTNFTLGDASTNGVIQSYDFAHQSVGIYMDKFGIVAKGGSVSGALITGGVIQTVSAGGARVALVGADNALNIYNSAGTKIGQLFSYNLSGTEYVGLLNSASSTGLLVGATGVFIIGNLTVTDIYTNSITMNSGVLDMNGHTINDAYNLNVNNVLTLDNPPTATSAPNLRVNTDGTVAKTGAVLGAADSGGTGYRMVRVPN